MCVLSQVFNKVIARKGGKAPKTLQNFIRILTMRLPKHQKNLQQDLFRHRLENIINMKHELVTLAHQIEWAKNGGPLRVDLIETVIDILKVRFKKYGKTEWGFEGTGETGHLMEPKAGWKRILDRAGIKDLRLYDLRRTLGSWQAATGANNFMIGRSLGHKNPQSTAVYKTFLNCYLFAT